ncbi:MAG: NADH-quinone oxidoreductase subunit D [Chloroflexi bacterium]|nr:NADH-quinone oxidoreductase subunit D [Chloroflexota bacterium]
MQHPAIKSDTFIVNVGPQHPSTHGVLRVRLLMDGERMLDLEPVFGYLHRSKEKLEEERTYIQTIPITDRMDYLASMSNNLGTCLAIEKLAGIAVPPRGGYIRVIMNELQRLASHCFALGTFLQDLGAWGGPLMYFLREREKIIDLFELVCGARLTYNYMRPGGVSQDLPPDFFPKCRQFMQDMPKYIDEYEELLLENEILQIRTRNVGILPRDLAINASQSGPMLRGSGVAFDLRKEDPETLPYDQFDFQVPVGVGPGDCFDRFWVRLQEMRESVMIVLQALDGLPAGPFKTSVPLALRPPAGDAYAHLESPRGMLGFYLVSDGGSSPWRFHVRAPSFINLTVLREMCVGHTIADLVVIIGSVDITMGDVDR